MFLDDVPGRQDVGALIIVSEQIADRSDLPPGNARRKCLEVLRNMPAGLRNDLQSSFHCALHAPALGEAVKRDTGNIC